MEAMTRSGNDRRGGWITFIVITLSVAAVVLVCWGATALGDDSFLPEEGTLASTVNFWGWISIAWGALLALAAWTGWGGLAGLVAPLFLFVSAAGFIIANSIAGALAGFPERAGAVSALVGALQYGSGILGSALVGLFADGTPWPMGWVIAACGLGSFACTWLLRLPGPAHGR